MNKVCPICGKEFDTDKSTKKYCSKQCLELARGAIYRYEDKTTHEITYSNNPKVFTNMDKYIVTSTPEDEKTQVARDRYTIRTYKELYNKVTNSETYSVHNRADVNKGVDVELARAYIEAHKDMLEENSIPVKIENTSNNIDINNRLDTLENKLDKIINLLTNNNSHSTIDVSKDMKLNLVSKLLEL